MPAAGGEPRRLTQAEDRLPRWSPDGKRVAFIGRRGDQTLPQIQIIEMAGGEARPLTNAPSAVSSFKWSPDGRLLAYTYTDPKTAAERTDDTQGRDWTVADKNYKHTRLYRVDAATGKSDLVTRTDVTVYDYDFSPDSQQLVIGAATTPTIDDSFMGVRLYIVPAAGGTPEPFVKTEGKLQFPRWSPDGRSIAWLGATTVDDPFAGTVFVAPVRADGRRARSRQCDARLRGQRPVARLAAGTARHTHVCQRRTPGRALLHDGGGVTDEAGHCDRWTGARRCSELLD